METTAIRLDLTMFEAGVLLSLMRLGMDTFCEERPHLPSLARLDRLPAEAFKTLATKLLTATEAIDQPPINLDRLGNEPLRVSRRASARTPG